MISKRKFIKNLKEQIVELERLLQVIHDEYAVKIEEINIKHQHNVNHLRGIAVQSKKERQQFQRSTMAMQVCLDSNIEKMKQYDEIINLVNVIKKMGKNEERQMEFKELG